jgi:hypothetical protein
MVGGKIAQLEARKRLAVEREDYDLAKALKADIEKLRNAGEAAAGVGAAGASPGENIKGSSSSSRNCVAAALLCQAERAGDSRCCR